MPYSFGGWHASTNPVLASEHLSTVGSVKQGSRAGWSVSRRQAITSRGVELTRADERRVGRDSASSTFQGLRVAGSLSSSWRGRLIRRPSPGTRLIQLPGAMLIGVGQGRARGNRRYAQVLEFPFGGG